MSAHWLWILPLIVVEVWYWCWWLPHNWRTSRECLDAAHALKAIYGRHSRYSPPPE